MMTTRLGGEPAPRRVPMASALVGAGRGTVAIVQAGTLTCRNMVRVAEWEISKGRGTRGAFPDCRSAWGRHVIRQAVPTCVLDLNVDRSRQGTSAWTGSSRRSL